MEQPCYRCGQSLEEGTPFCPHCSAPQIRVIVAEAAPVAPSSEIIVNAQGEAALPASKTVPVLAVSMKWSRAVKPCALAAMVALLLMALGLHPLMAMFTVGFLSVAFFRLGTPGVELKGAFAAGMGALGGLFWFMVLAIFGVGSLTLLNKGPELRTELIARIQQTASQTNDPQMLALLDRFKTPGGLEFLIIVGSLIILVAAIVLASAGGALAGAVLGRRNKS